MFLFRQIAAVLTGALVGWSIGPSPAATAAFHISSAPDATATALAVQGSVLQ